MTDLFTTANPATPLAERLRPKTIDDVIGQRHLLAPGKPLAVAFAAGKPHSMILWGPPGSGKTTLARLMADAFNAQFIAISAVLAGVKDRVLRPRATDDLGEDAPGARRLGPAFMLVLRSGKHFRDAPRDRPLAAFVWLEPVDEDKWRGVPTAGLLRKLSPEVSAPGAEGQLPPTLVDPSTKVVRRVGA